ncbi:hypothetical protein M0R72_07715 [Candidatus Pacearchaeota archaeon]|jgi:hypothetical protein|nr:hypothetical protein [Candidatus Pacearchaeota archaeon]
MPSKAQMIVDKILDDLTDRRGLRQEWEQVDRETQKEIRAEWRRIIESVLEE